MVEYAGIILARTVPFTVEFDLNPFTSTAIMVFLLNYHSRSFAEITLEH